MDEKIPYIAFEGEQARHERTAIGGKAMRDYSRAELTGAIDEWILNEKHRAIMKRRLIDGICFEPLAEEFDMSPRQIKRIVYKCEDIVFRHI